eukprot:Seg4532.2 transcript_id=Seg4532.2/GoldUCD/mRNA.D3Y31 product=Amphiphysin protein_id=Seg4532.2/GoldUCD/D3Y31
MMADKQEKNSEKGFLARTATYTSKRARRAQEKFMQKVGKLDETKDEVFDEFVNNFNKQQTAVSRLQKELKQYLQCLASMQVASNAFADAVKEIYEPDWVERDSLVNLFEELDANFLTLNRRLNDEVLEPLEAYHRPFGDVKTKVSKRGRKRVDYDHCRHVVDTLRAKGTAKSGDAKKLSQAEDDYQKAKSIFVELTSELYDELPALYDCRIGFYVSCFQSVFTLEGVFHRECARIQNQLNDLMDQLIKDVSAGSYSTKKSFARDDEQEAATIAPINPKPDGSLATFYDVAVPDEDEGNESTDENVVMNGEKDQEAVPERELPPAPARPAPVRPAPQRPSSSHTPSPPQGSPDRPKSVSPRNVQSSNTESESSDVAEAAEAKPEIDEKPDLVVFKNPNMNKSGTPQCNLIVPQSLFKAIATHSYTAEDEDELGFEKGEIVHVVEFDDPEEQDEGWLMGILDSSGMKGVFPENFTQRLDT